MIYMRARIGEWSTMVAVVIAAVVIGLWLAGMIGRSDVLSGAVASFAAWLAPDSVFMRGGRIIVGLAERAALSNTPRDPVLVALPKEQMSMSILSDVETAVENAAIPAIEASIGALLASGSISPEVGKLITDFKAALLDAMAGKLTGLDAARVLDDALQAGLALEAKTPPVVTAAETVTA